MDLKNRIPCAIMNQGKSMLIDKTSILSQNLGHYQCVEQVRHSPEKVFARLIRPNVDQRSVQVKKNGFEMIH